MDPIEDTPRDEAACMVKVRLTGERKFWFVTPTGGMTNRRLHAALIWGGRDAAVAIADEVLAAGADSGVAAVAVMQAGQRVYHAGAPTPPSDAFTGGGFRYLSGVTQAGRGVFRILDEAGAWAPFDEDTYGECITEADRAGVRSDRLIVHASLNLLATDDVTFRQESAGAAVPAVMRA